MTPASYPQTQAPIIDNPAFWERLGLDPIGTDTLFFAFYYQQVSCIPLVKWLQCHLKFQFSIYTSVEYISEHLPAILSCKGIEKAIMEIPQEI